VNISSSHQVDRSRFDQANPANNTKFSTEGEVKKTGVAGLRKRKGPSGNYRKRGVENGHRKVSGANAKAE